MQASRLFLSTVAAAGLFGFSSLAVAQTTQTTTPGSTTSTTTNTTTGTSNLNETAAQRMDRERMERERMERERQGTSQGTGTDRMGSQGTGSSAQGMGTDRPGMSNDRSSTGAGSNQWSTDSRNTGNRDASGNLRARADRN
jgi:hypothetical protein